MAHYVFYFDDSTAGVEAADRIRSETNDDVILYDILACREAEKADALTFTADVPEFERARIEKLFGSQGEILAGEHHESTRDPLDHDGDGRKGGSLPHLSVGKGPGGRFYVKRGKEIVTGPYASEDEAREALANETSAQA